MRRGGWEVVATLVWMQSNRLLLLEFQLQSWQKRVALWLERRPVQLPEVPSAYLTPPEF